MGNYAHGGRAGWGCEVSWSHLSVKAFPCLCPKQEMDLAGGEGP